jgi:DNA-binding FadR family transcriptional regulator
LVAERIRASLRAGELRTGDRVPHERELIEQDATVAQSSVRGTDRLTSGFDMLRRCLAPPGEGPGGVRSFRPQNNRFHRVLAEAAHNNVLAVVTNIIMELSLRLTKTEESQPARLTEVHRGIIDAIATPTSFR